MVELSSKFKLPSFIEPLAEDGILLGSNIILIGLPGNGKTIFCENFAKSCFENDIKCLYVTLDKTTDDIKYNFRSGGIDLDDEKNKERVVFVDGHAWLIGKSQTKYTISSLSNLTELNFNIFNASSELPTPFLFVLNSLSPLTLYNPEGFVLKFLQLLFARLKELGCISIFVVQDGVHKPEFYNTLEYLVDGIFDMKIGEHKGAIRRYLRIRSLSSVAHDTRWVPFNIKPDRSLELHFGSDEEG